MGIESSVCAKYTSHSIHFNSTWTIIKFSRVHAAVEARDGNRALGTVLASVMGADGRVNIEHLKKMIQQRLKKGAGWVYLLEKIIF